MKSKNILKCLLITAIVGLIAGCSVIQPGERGVKYYPYRLNGLRVEKIYDDGIIWRLPWGVVKYNIQWQTYQENIAILTQDELHTTIMISVILRPKEDELAKLILEIGEDYYKKIIQPELFTVARSAFAKYKYMDLAQKSALIENEIMAELKTRIAGSHIELDKIAINHIVYSKIVTDATDEKLSTKQKIEQKDYEILIAEKDAQIQRILAKGQKDAQIIIGDSITSKYLQFKSLQVQEKLATSSNAKFYFVPTDKNGIPIIVDGGK